MSSPPSLPLYVAAIIERANNDILIALHSDDETASRRWSFPRGRAEPHESPEKAMRRVALQILGVTVEIVVGQPPISAKVEGQEALLRYFFCGVISGEPASQFYGELRWIPKAHLCEYDFDTASEPVAKWLVER